MFIHDSTFHQSHISKTHNLSICNLIAELDLTPKKGKKKSPFAYTFVFIFISFRFGCLLNVNVNFNHFCMDIKNANYPMFHVWRQLVSPSFHRPYGFVLFHQLLHYLKKKWILFPMPIAHNGSFICAFIHLIYPAKKKMAFIIFLIQFPFSALTG